MKITLELPDNTIRIKYTVDDGGAYESEDKPVTFGMIVKVGDDSRSLLDGLATITNVPYTNKITDSTQVCL